MVLRPPHEEDRDKTSVADLTWPLPTPWPVRQQSPGSGSVSRRRSTKGPHAITDLPIKTLLSSVGGGFWLVLIHMRPQREAKQCVDAGVPGRQGGDTGFNRSPTESMMVNSGTRCPQQRREQACLFREEPVQTPLVSQDLGTNSPEAPTGP